MENSLTLFEKPRTHHYYFVHRYLLELLDSNPLGMWENLNRPAAVSYLGIHWWQVGIEVKSGDPDQDGFVRAEGLEVIPPQANAGGQIIIIKLPPPERMTEAYFVAIVRRTEPEDFSYFTLELTGDRAGVYREALLCEWQKGNHINMGAGVLPDVKSFLSAVATLIQGRRSLVP